MCAGLHVMFRYICIHYNVHIPRCVVVCQNLQSYILMYFIFVVIANCNNLFCPSSC